MKRLQPRLGKWVEGDDLDASVDRILQVVKHSRRGRTNVLRKIEDAVAILEIGQNGRTDRSADAFRQGDGCAFVAHV